MTLASAVWILRVDRQLLRAPLSHTLGAHVGDHS